MGRIGLGVQVSASVQWQQKGGYDLEGFVAASYHKQLAFKKIMSLPVKVAVTHEPMQLRMLQTR